MSGKIEIRKLAELACGTPQDSPEYKRFIAAMNPTLLLDLTAPVVERQPVGWVSYIGNGFIRVRCSVPPRIESPLYDAPPELAGLQATIAKLTEQLAAQKINLELSTNSAAVLAETADEEVAALKSEIERLKGGQGEPVAYRYKEGHAAWENEKPWEPTTLEHGAVLLERKARASAGEFKGDSQAYYLALAVEPLFASQPAPVSSELVQLLERAKVYARGPFLDEINACLERQPSPVSVVLPERVDVSSKSVPFRNNYIADGYISGWNACLDKVKELNQ